MLGGCRETDDVGPSIEVMPRDHLFLVEVTGDLVASESIPVSLPGDVKMSFNIVWLLPEYSEVREGEVVARFGEARGAPTPWSTRHGVPVGTFVESAETAAKWYRLGVTYLAYSVDIGLFLQGCKQVVQSTDQHIRKADHAH